MMINIRNLYFENIKKKYQLQEQVLLMDAIKC